MGTLFRWVDFYAPLIFSFLLCRGGGGEGRGEGQREGEGKGRGSGEGEGEKTEESVKSSRKKKRKKDGLTFFLQQGDLSSLSSQKRVPIVDGWVWYGRQSHFFWQVCQERKGNKDCLNTCHSSMIYFFFFRFR